MSSSRLDVAGLGPTAYDLVSPSSVAFGVGRFAEVGGIVARHGRAAWVVAGSRSLAGCGGRSGVEAVLGHAGLDVGWIAAAGREPTVADVAAAVRSLPATGRGDAVIVAIGGGAVIDLAKAVAAIATNGDPAAADVEQVVIDHLEGVGRGLPITAAPLPLIAVPTTAGTGHHERAPHALLEPPLRARDHGVAGRLGPRAAVVDPALTVTCGRGVTAASGLDCITQLIESFVCRFAAPLPRALVLDALPRAVAALPRVLAAPGDLDARAAMSHAAFVSGVALTNSGLGLAHGVAAALGIECGTPHGEACALMLPVALRVNRVACRDDLARLERSVDPGAAADADEAADAFLARIDALCDLAGTPRRLAEVGLARDRLGWLVENSSGASMRGNPVSLEPAGLRGVLEAAY
ncbi:MAG: iron-containing alcohol dehydrogenase [Pirellulales bacterium]